MLEGYEERELISSFRRKGISKNEYAALLEAAEKELERGRPLAYITGEQPFYNLAFYVDERVLVPRPDTERVVDKALALAPPGSFFADLCTGSGCIALTLLYNRRDLTAAAFDISADALEVARRNTERLGLSDRIEYHVEDVLKPASFRRSFDFIISNPPYIKTGSISDYPSLSFEPNSALDGGRDGLDFYRAIVENWSCLLSPDGFFLFEIGYDQAADIIKIAGNAGFSCGIFRDYGGNDRVALLKKNQVQFGAL